MRLFRLLSVLLALASAAPAAGQTSLTLAEAIARARDQNLQMEASRIAEREAAQQVVQARAGYFPHVDATEGWQRGNHPVFVFSSLLAQRRFAAADFALDALNHPDSIHNLRAAVALEQPLFDPAVRPAVKAASAAVESAAVRTRLIDTDLAVAATQAYGQVLVAIAEKQAAEAAIQAAGADRELAGNRRDAGLATDADVLQIDVQLARMREQQIRAEADDRIARARLNDVMGEPLDAAFVLERIPPATTAASAAVETLEAEALRNRPDLKLAELQEEMAAAAQERARAEFLPRFTAQAGWEANGGRWNSRSSSWVIGVGAQMNLFRGFADRARLAESAELRARRAVEREHAERAARLEVRTAVERLGAARASEHAGRTAATQARESRRIVRDRYESGLADVAALLRAAEAVQQAEARETAAQVEVVVAAAAVERALGK